jgi:D-beta-D-heptose 7-phosphate kinase/D-beta-D-heptose 1-phosphate adenosyltransferase
MIFDIRDPLAKEVLMAYLQTARESGKTIGLTSGSFDLIHFHHVLFFTRCQRYCDILVVGVDSDELVRERKGPGRPLIYDSRRLAMVDALKPVAFACIIGSVADFGLAAELVEPDIIFKNDTFAGRESEIVGKEHAKRIMIVSDVVEHTSTTEILKEAARIVTGEKRQT